MKRSIYAAIVAVALVAGTAVAAVADDSAAVPFQGPRPSSLNNYTGVAGRAVPANVPDATPFDGPRRSSLDNFPGMTSQTAPAAEPSATPFDGPRPGPAH